MIGMTVRLEGMDKTLKRVREITARAPEAFERAIYLMGTNILSTSLKLAPVATGHLRKTRYLTEPKLISGNNTMTQFASFKFSLGYSAPYAIFVHEINKRYVVGEWKFLEKAVQWHAPRMFTDMARWAATFLANGTPPFAPHHPTGPFIGPVPPRLGRRRMKGETSRQRKARVRFNAALSSKRAKGREKNAARILAEAQAYTEAMAAGRRPPRPGRGG